MNESTPPKEERSAALSGHSCLLYTSDAADEL